MSLVRIQSPRPFFARSIPGHGSSLARPRGWPTAITRSGVPAFDSRRITIRGMEHRLPDGRLAARRAGAGRQGLGAAARPADGAFVPGRRRLVSGTGAVSEPDRHEPARLRPRRVSILRRPVARARDRMREQLYAGLVGTANRWQESFGQDGRFPETHAEFRDRCHRAGQTRPTPLLLQYERRRLQLPAPGSVRRTTCFPCRLRRCCPSPARTSMAASLCSPNSVRECSHART